MIGFFILGSFVGPWYLFWRFKPLPVIQALIGCSIYFFIGGTIGGLATLVIGYPLNLVCEKLSWTREQRRWFLAFAIPFISVAILIALFTHRNNIWEPASNLLKFAFPLSFLVCVIIFASDKVQTSFRSIKLSSIVKSTTVVGVSVAGFIAICFFGPMNRGTPKLYDYATEIVDPSRLRTSQGLGELSELQSANLWYLVGQEHFLDGKPVDMPPFKEFDEVVYAENAPTRLPDERMVQIQTHNGRHIFLFDRTGNNGIMGPSYAPNKYGSSEVALDNKRVLFIGGHINQKPLSDIELFDIEEMSLTKIGNLNIPRHSHKSIRLHNGNVLVIGGITTHHLSDAGELQTSTIELVDTKTMNSKIVGQLQKARIEPLAYPFELDKALIFRGKINDEAVDMKEIGGEEVREFELYTGKKTESKKGMYPPDLWFWGIIDTLRSINRKSD